MKRVFISGPLTQGDLCHNVNQATEAFLRLAKAGLSPFCPHWSVYAKKVTPRRRVNYCPECQKETRLPIGTCNDCEYLTDVWCQATTDGHPDMTHREWMRIDLDWVAVADAVLRLPGPSKGADMECARAKELGIPVFYSVDDLLRKAVPE
jgi:hypothetical protein